MNDNRHTNQDQHCIPLQVSEDKGKAGYVEES